MQGHGVLLSSAALLILFFALGSCTNAASEKAKSTNQAPTTAASPIDGNWVTIWGRYNGNVEGQGKPTQFKTFQDGFFSMIAWDSSGKLSYAGYGKYELQGNKYKETMIYHTAPEYIGGYDWQEYELKGDTLYFRGFDSVVVGGKNVTADFGRIEEKRVRAK